mmetsp:Transcript_53095/g.126927  ORF Transcript_53095/g.126927 Transcript_53095/m.126927 type:complete len:264 (-) Transcript_53095:3110-3901(-)
MGHIHEEEGPPVHPAHHHGELDHVAGEAFGASAWCARVEWQGLVEPLPQGIRGDADVELENIRILWARKDLRRWVEYQSPQRLLDVAVKPSSLELRSALSPNLQGRPVLQGDAHPRVARLDDQPKGNGLVRRIRSGVQGETLPDLQASPSIGEEGHRLRAQVRELRLVDDRLHHEVQRALHKQVELVPVAAASVINRNVDPREAMPVRGRLKLQPSWTRLHAIEVLHRGVEVDQCRAHLQAAVLVEMAPRLLNLHALQATEHQ